MFTPRQPMLAHPPRPEILSPGKLVAEAQALANNNPRFRRGEVHEMGFELYEAEIPEATAEIIQWEYETMQLPDVVETMPEPEAWHSRVSLTYHFSAERTCRADTAPVVDYTFSASVQHDNIELPEHIAAQLVDESSEEAAEMFGPVSLRRMLHFMISTSDRQLKTCESYDYLDEDDDLLSSVCSCDGDDLQDDPGNFLSLDEAAYQVLNRNAQQHIKHEAIIALTPEEALAAWTFTSKLDPSEIEADIAAGNLALAFGTPRGLRYTLRQQAGLK